MATYYVDDGGNDSDGSSWANAYTTMAGLIGAVTIASDDVIVVGHDSVDASSTQLTLDGPTTGAPATIISATTGSDPVAYQKGTTNQIATSSGYILLRDSWVVQGIQFAAPNAAAYTVMVEVGQNQYCYMKDCKIIAADDRTALKHTDSDALLRFEDVEIDLSADSGTTTTYAVIDCGADTRAEFIGVSTIGGGDRTGNNGALITTSSEPQVFFSGCDFSSLSNATPALFEPGAIVARNCKFPSGVKLNYSGSDYNYYEHVIAVGCGDSYSPSALEYYTPQGYSKSTSTVYRVGLTSDDNTLVTQDGNYLVPQDGTPLAAGAPTTSGSGAFVGNEQCSWQVITSSFNYEGNAFRTPWIYGTISSGTSTTFTSYIANDNADLDDSEIWLEVEIFETTGNAKTTLLSGQRESPASTATTHTDDTLSSWTGGSASFTYKQSLSVTGTPIASSFFRARVAVAATSVAEANYLYIDPKVELS